MVHLANRRPFITKFGGLLFAANLCTLDPGLVSRHERRRAVEVMDAGEAGLPSEVLWAVQEIQRLRQRAHGQGAESRRILKLPHVWRALHKARTRHGDARDQ